VPRSSVLTIREDELAMIRCAADRFFTEHIGIHKLLVVDSEDRLRGLFTLSDIERITQERLLQTKPARDGNSACSAARRSGRPQGLRRTRQQNLLDHMEAMVERGWTRWRSRSLTGIRGESGIPSA